MNEFERRHVRVGDRVDIDVMHEQFADADGPVVSARTVNRYVGKVRSIDSSRVIIWKEGCSVVVKFDKTEITFNKHEPYLENGWYRVNFSRENGSSSTHAYYYHDKKWYSDEERVYSTNFKSADATFMDRMTVDNE